MTVSADQQWKGSSRSDVHSDVLGVKSVVTSHSRKGRKRETYHLPVVLHLPEERLMAARTLIPASNQLTVVGHSAVLVPGGVVAQVQHFAALFFVGGGEHKTCSLVQTEKKA